MKTTLVPGVGRVPYPAYQGKEPYIFVSYSHADSNIVFEEIKRLNELGYNVWYDEGIAPGNEWTDEIAKTLSGCAVFIVMITPRSVESDNVQNEIYYALDEGKTFFAIHLQQTVLKGGLKLRMNTKQAILKYLMTQEEYEWKVSEALSRFGIPKKSFKSIDEDAHDRGETVCINDNHTVPMKRPKWLIPSLISAVLLVAILFTSQVLKKDISENTIEVGSMIVESKSEPDSISTTTTSVGNVLMADTVGTVPVGQSSDEYYKSFPVFGSKYKRKEISSLTFHHSMEEVSNDAWDVSALSNRSVLAWVVPDEYADGLYELHIAADGEIIAPTNSNQLFAGYEALRSISFNGYVGNDSGGSLSIFNTENVTNMNGMFSGCTNLRSIDISGFNTRKVSSFASMFFRCENLESISLSGIDTTNATNMTYMFMGCKKLKELDVSGFDTGNVTSMFGLFDDCSSISSLDVSGFNTENVTDMGDMFQNCSRLKNLDLRGFNTECVKKMNRMFSGCSGLIDLDLSGFSTENVEEMAGMFYNCEKLQMLDLSCFNTGEVSKMSYMFSGCSRLSDINISGFITENVEEMQGMFHSCKKLEKLDLSGFDTKKVTNMNGMFSMCEKLKTLDLSGFNTESVIDMGSLFYGCADLINLDVSGFNTKNVTTMKSMFNNCKSLTSLDVSRFNTENVIDMGSMFQNCGTLTSLDVTSFDTKNVISMSYMFSGCKNLKSLDVSGFNTESLINADYMFGGCSNLSELRK